MKKQLHLDQKTWEAMESCRPGVNDLADPAMSHLADTMAIKPDLEKMFDRIELLDAKIGAAFHDVAVPPGLLQQISNRLADARAKSGISSTWIPQSDQIAPQGMAKILPAGGARKFSRSRWMLVSAGLFCTTGVLFIALWLSLHNVEKYTEQMVLDEAIRFLDTNTVDAGFLLAERAPPKAYPFSRAVLLSKGIRWREIRDFLGQTGFAYDLPSRDGARATLYVIRERIEGLGNKPRLQPFTTGGYSASAWQEGGLLYVLVVQGEPKIYQNYLDLPHGPTA